MKLSTKTFLLLITITLISFSAAIYNQRAYITPTLVELEARADQKDIERVILGFDTFRDLLGILVADNSESDDMFDFFSTKNPTFIKRSFDIVSYLGAEFDLAMMVDLQGQIIWSNYVDSENEEFFPAGAFDASELLPYVADAASAAPGAPISLSGIIATSNGPMIFASHSVLKSDESGQSPGSVLFGRYINQHLVEEVSENSKVDFSIAVIDHSQRIKLAQQNLTQQQRNSQNQISWYLADIDDRPLVRLTLQLGERAYDNTMMPMIIALAIMLLSWIIIILILNRVMIAPILTIGRHLHTIQQTGDYSARINSQRRDEIGTLGDQCDYLMEHIEQQHQIVDRQAQDLLRMSYEDGLTSLANRRRFDQLLSDYWQLHQRDKQPLSILMCDIDYFKNYNDRYGHQQGDDALIKVAAALKAGAYRKSDLVARYGGEEFVVVLANSDQTAALQVAEQLQQQIKSAAIEHLYSKVDAFITLSIGIATAIPTSDKSQQELIKQADLALYSAKHQGRNRSLVYQPSMDTLLDKKA